MAADKNPRNNATIDYDPRNPFVVCASSMKPIFKGNTALVCGVCGASYRPDLKGSLCTVCEIGGIGRDVSGLNCVRPDIS